MRADRHGRIDRGASTQNLSPRRRNGSLVVIPPRRVPPVVIMVRHMGGAEHAFGNLLEAVSGSSFEEEDGSGAVLGESGR